MSTHNDPLDPVYGQGKGLVEEVEHKSGVVSKTNLAVLTIVILLCLSLLYYFGREKPSVAPAPTATEIK